MPLSESEELELLELEKEYSMKNSGEKPGYLESAVRGAGQGLSLGFEDEIRAGLMAPFSDQSYDQLVGDIRSKNKAAEEANPKTFYAGEIGGAVLPALLPAVPLGAAGSAVKNALTLKRAADPLVVGASETAGLLNKMGPRAIKLLKEHGEDLPFGKSAKAVYKIGKGLLGK